MQDPKPIPAFITPVSLNELDDKALRAHLEPLRLRRISAARAYEASKIRAAAETSHKLQKQMVKQLELFKKELGRTDALLSKIEGRINRIAGIKLELEQLPVAEGVVPT